MKIIVTGPKGVGKSTIGKRIAETLHIPFFETDEIIESLFEETHGNKKSCRQIAKEFGESFFRELEKEAIKQAALHDWCVIATGGGAMLFSENRIQLRKESIVILLKAEVDFLWQRVQITGIPPFLQGADAFDQYCQRVEKLYEATEHMSDIIYTISKENEESAHEDLIQQISFILSQWMYAPNTFGQVLKVTTFGESHGKALGAVVDGLKPGIPLSAEDIQKQLDRRRPGQSTVSTQRKEADSVEIVSGLFEGKTTGTPLCMIVYNKDPDSKAYESIKDIFRPGHADFTFWQKYGIRDYRGGGRSSGRETVARVAAGAIALKMLKEKGVEIVAYADEIAGIKGERVDINFIEKNPVRAADPDKAHAMEEAIKRAQADHDSVGGIVECIVKGMPIGLGDPVFYKLDARLAMAVMSIGAVKGVEFGSGFAAARMRGSENNDQMSNGKFLTNNAGGILGGISTGQDVVMRIAVKPTPSIAKIQKTMDIHGDSIDVSIKGRHDPCIVPRIIPVIEAMVALVVYDALLLQERIGRYDGTV
jgi:chorismate synthase